MYEEQALMSCLSEIANARLGLIAKSFTSAKGKGGSDSGKQMLATDIRTKKMELSVLTEKSDMTLAKIVVASGLLNQLARDTAK